MTSSHAKKPGISRRSMLVGTTTGTLAGLLAGTGIGYSIPDAQPETTATSSSPGSTHTPGEPVAAHGATQAGVARPETPQPHGLVVVADIELDAAQNSLAALGNTILQLTNGELPTVTPDGPADLSVLVGVGPRILETSSHPELSQRLAMPTFAGDNELPEQRLGGDLLLSISCWDPTILEPVATALAQSVAGYQLRWSQLGFRGSGEAGVARNPLGYHDGVIVPRGAEDLDTNVWLSEGPLAGGTICVLRTFALDTTAFSQLSPDEQDGVMGRQRTTGAPLSGGELHDEVVLTARTDDGQFVVPNNAHIRAAHPSFTGSDLMLRRSYSYLTNHEAGPEHGLMFTAFQRDIETFNATQLRMDEMDALMEFSTVRSTAAFAILPGYSATTPLGATLI